MHISEKALKCVPFHAQQNKIHVMRFVFFHGHLLLWYGICMRAKTVAKDKRRQCIRALCVIECEDDMWGEI